MELSYTDINMNVAHYTVGITKSKYHYANIGQYSLY